MKKGTLVDIDTLSKEERITRDGGEKLRILILKSEPPITIDFKQKPIASVSFWDESIAKLLLEGWSECQIREKVFLINVHPRDIDIIDKLMMARLKNQ